MSSSLSDRYNPQEVEGPIYEWWEQQGYFKAKDISTKPPFSIILPPPNVTGSLHLGHALDQAIQDTLIRWKRMSGYNTLWQPGTDHAGIATQSVVEKQLKKEGLFRKELGRKKFEERVWQWKQEYGDRIVNQLKRMGGSCDWDRLVFTLDEGVSKAVRKVFVSLYEKGLIYKGTQLINWSPTLESALSDLEVDHREVNGSLWHVKYDLEDGSDHLVVATTRPETMLGDSAVAIHPEDERYKNFIGKKLKLPLTQRLIPIITDEYVDKEFGSGAVKITPAHDFNDYKMGQRHNLEFINILNCDGTLNEAGEAYKGLQIMEARKQVVADLTEQNFLIETKKHKHSVGHCSRTGCVVEPFLSEQWFVKAGELAPTAKQTVLSETTVFEPELWTKTYLHWMNIIEDWCISRQLWWGHRIPAWHCKDCDQMIVSEEPLSICSQCESKNLEQEEDVLDTWFSSSLWPFTTLGWPEETEALKTFYPTDVLVTGHDIIFFWVARMMMMGLEFKNDVPFRKVYLHGLIRDSQGRKMSKSLGNSVDPVDSIEKYGADALRFTLLAQVASGKDLKFSEQRLEGYRNFMNKIWNASRFTLSLIEQEKLTDYNLPKTEHMSDVDCWIVTKLSQCEQTMDSYLQQNRFSEATHTIYQFVWHEFCDWYLEFIKPIVYGEDQAKKNATLQTLTHTLNRVLRLLHPFTPFITEAVYQKLPVKNEALIIDDYPTLKNDKDFLSLGSEDVAFKVDLVKEVIAAIRNIRGENRIKPGEKIKSYLVANDVITAMILKQSETAIVNLSNLKELKVGSVESMSQCAVTKVCLNNSQVDVVVPLEGLVDFDEEIKRINKNIQKLAKETQGIESRLENANFVKNAPEEIVKEAQQQVAENKGQLQTLKESLMRLSS